MIGNHCLKTWSKTQAIIAKSSAEAELYGVVRGATESLGMNTLIKDLGGSQLQIQLHLDATAAKGIVERRGLSKVRHVDVNVLWLQETCARKTIPMNKVPGEENCADLMTKHLAAKTISKNVERMRMSFESGRAAKAAALHAVSFAKGTHTTRDDHSCTIARCTNSDVDDPFGGDLSSWQAVRAAANDQRGGDRWRSRGAEGVWHRWHTSPRTSLFTPYKVAKGPASSISLKRLRFTYGVTAKGRCFEFHDDWTKPERAHMVLDEPWTGYTIFTERREGYAATLNGRSGDTSAAAVASTLTSRWADA